MTYWTSYIFVKEKMQRKTNYFLIIIKIIANLDSNVISINQKKPYPNLIFRKKSAKITHLV